jgi:two-component system sensor kinase FixL
LHAADSPILVDRIQIQQVVVNLIRNAAEAMATSARIKPFASTKPGGMGLGLSLCRSIIEAHEGRIRAEPNRQGGTTFRFTVPIVPEALTQAG